LSSSRPVIEWSMLLPERREDGKGCCIVVVICENQRYLRVTLKCS
jgi:hypothetical protein